MKIPKSNHIEIKDSKSKISPIILKSDVMVPNLPYKIQIQICLSLDKAPKQISKKPRKLLMAKYTTSLKD